MADIFHINREELPADEGGIHEHVGLFRKDFFPVRLGRAGRVDENYLAVGRITVCTEEHLAVNIPDRIEIVVKRFDDRPE